MPRVCKCLRAHRLVWLNVTDRASDFLHWTRFFSQQYISALQVLDKCWHGMWVGLRGFSKVVATSTMWAGPFNLFLATAGDV